MHTSALAVFRQVARDGSFTTAAQALGYTQSAISRQISGLESELNARLFDRVARGVRLTEEGQILLTHADAVLGHLNSVRADLAALHELTAGRLRLGAFPTANAALVPRALADFTQQHPDIAVTLTEGRTAEHMDALRTGGIDVAIVSGYDPHPAQPDIQLHRLLDDPILVGLPLTHRLAKRRTVRLVELSDENWIAGSKVVQDTLISACMRRGFQPRIDFVVAEWLAKLGMVAAGLGVTLVPSTAASAVRDDVVLVRLHADETPVRSVYTATLDGSTPSPAVREFVRLLEEHSVRVARRE